MYNVQPAIIMRDDTGSVHERISRINSLYEAIATMRIPERLYEESITRMESLIFRCFVDEHPSL